MRFPFAVVVCCAASLLTSCVGVYSARSVTKSYASELPAAGLRELAVKGANGDVEAYGADVKAIEIRARIETNDLAALPDDTVAISRNGDTAVIASACSRAAIGFWSIQNCGIDYDIRYPKSMHVSVETVNGDVTIGDAGAAVDAKTTNGDVTIRDSSSDVSARSQQGDVTVSLVPAWHGSTVGMSTRFGDVRLEVPEAFRGDVRAHTIAGDVDGLSSIAAGPADVDLSTMFGDVTVSRGLSR